jgi:hypothetical protein
VGIGEAREVADIQAPVAAVQVVAMDIPAAVAEAVRAQAEVGIRAAAVAEAVRAQAEVGIRAAAVDVRPVAAVIPAAADTPTVASPTDRQTWNSPGFQDLLAINRVQNIRTIRLGKSGSQRARPGGRKPPLVAEFGQFIFHERISIWVRFTKAKELRGAASRRVWHGTCIAMDS